MAKTQTHESAAPSRNLFWYKLGVRIAQHAPTWLGNLVARVAALVVLTVDKPRRLQVERNLCRVYGSGLGYWQMRWLQARTFTNYGRYWFEILHHRPGKDILAPRFSSLGLEHFNQVLEQGKGVVVALPHFGNWDLAGAWFAELGYQPWAVAEILEPKEIFEWFVSQRAATGLKVIPYDSNAFVLSSQVLRNNQVLCLLCDRNLDGNGVTTWFFSEQTALPAGPALLAVRNKSAIVPVGIYRQKHNKFLVDFGQPLWPTQLPGENLREATARVTQEVTNQLENIIRRTPEQWLMMQSNWPSDEATSPGD